MTQPHSLAPLLLLLALLQHWHVAIAQESYNFYESCTSRSDCNGGMWCETLKNDGTLESCSSSGICFCAEDDTCTSSAECFATQRCAKFLPSADTAYCVPCTGGPAGLSAPVSVDADYNSCSGGGAATTPTPEAPTPTPVASGKPFSPCSSSSDCDSMWCEAVKNDGSLSVCPGAETPCFCSEDDSCTTSADCNVGTRCAKFVPGADPADIEKSTTAYCLPCDGAPAGLLPPVSVDTRHTCVASAGSATATTSAAATVTPSPSGDSSAGSGDSTTSPSTAAAADSPLPSADSGSGSGSGSGGGSGSGRPSGNRPVRTPRPTSASSNSTNSNVCVDAALLSHLPPSRLVFRAHQRARVLCDAHGSCATPGHVAVFRGRALTMRRYCERADVRCVEREMDVNSVQYYARAVRVPSRTEGLEFTAFASRFGTRLEEVMLRAAVHAGL